MTPRHLFAVLIVAVLLLVGGTSVHAQDGGLLSADLQADYVYGETLRFMARVEGPEPLMAATLYLQVGTGLDEVLLAVPIQQPAPYDLSWTIGVDELSLPPFAVVAYRWEFTGNSGAVYQTEAGLLRYEDDDVPWRWEASSTERVTVYTGSPNHEAAEPALGIAVDALARTESLLNVGPVPHVEIYIYPELPDMVSSLRLHGERVQDWVAAYAVPNSQIALVAASPGLEMLPNLERDVPHEVAHLVVASTAPAGGANVPAWFNEGLALYLVGDTDPALEKVLDDTARGGAFLPLGALCGPGYFGLGPREAALAYAQSESLVRYIHTRYGVGGIRALLAAFNGGATCDEAVPQALGLSLAELETQWHNQVLSQAASSPSSDASIVPWLVVWALSMVLALLFTAPQPRRSPSPQTGSDSSSSQREDSDWQVHS
jgi:hypothetical protein